MKKLRFLLCVSLLCLCGCAGKYKNKNDQIYDYFPFNKNTVYAFEGAGHVLASYCVYNTIINENRMQRLLAPDIESYGRQTEVFEVKDGELRLINGDTYKYHYEDLTQLSPAKDMLLLKEPLTLGAVWEVEEGTSAEVTGVNISVNVPAGKYKALEITYVYEDGFTQKDYYAKGTGLIKTEYSVSGGDLISSSLASVTKNTSLTTSYNYFSPDYASGNLDVASGYIELETNYDLIEILNTILFGAAESAILTDVTFGDNENSVKLTFNESIYDRDYKQSSDETAALHAYALTAGSLTGADKAYINVNGAPYKGRFIEKALDEFFVTNLDMLNQAQ